MRSSRPLHLALLLFSIFFTVPSAFASTQSNSSACSGTLITTAISTTCTGSQDFPDEYSIQDSFGDTVGAMTSNGVAQSNNGYLFSASPDDVYRMEIYQLQPNLFNIILPSGRMTGYLDLYDNTGAWIAEVSKFPYDYGTDELLDISSNPTAVFVVDSGTNCGTEALDACMSGLGSYINGYGYLPPAPVSSPLTIASASSSPIYTQDSGNISFELAILIVFILIGFCGYIFNRMIGKKVWQK